MPRRREVLRRWAREELRAWAFAAVLILLIASGGCTEQSWPPQQSWTLGAAAKVSIAQGCDAP